MWEALKALILIKTHTGFTMTGPWLRVREQGVQFFYNWEKGQTSVKILVFISDLLQQSWKGEKRKSRQVQSP